MNNNLRKCVDCDEMVSVNANVCPNCGSTQNQTFKKVLISLMIGVPLSGAFLLATTMYHKAEKDSLNLYFFTTFILLSILLYLIKNKIKELGDRWDYNENVSKKLTYILFLPSWVTYVSAFDAPLSIWYKSNIGFTDTSVAISWILTIILLVFGYKKFLRYFNLID
jgi:hypothetical protein